MKKIECLILLMLIVAANAFGQPQKMTPEDKLKIEMDVLTSSLSLTTEQKAQITPLLKEAQRRQTELLRDMCCDSGGLINLDKKLIEESNKITSELDLSIGAVITKQQLLKLQAVREKQKKAVTF
jgi:hypothetical protein